MEENHVTSEVPLTLTGEVGNRDTVFFMKENGASKEIVKLCENGDIFIKGNLAENDKQVVDAFREFLKGVGLLREQAQKQKEHEEIIKKIITYIEEEAEVLIPVNELFNEDGAHLTKRQYGGVVIKYLAEELRQKFLPNNGTEQPCTTQH